MHVDDTVEILPDVDRAVYLLHANNVASMHQTNACHPCECNLQAMQQGEGFERGQKATAAGLAAASLVKVLGPQQVCLYTVLQES